jgi:putative peptidoglycan lipid II flippase
LVTFSAYKVLVPAFYAEGDTRTPVRTGLVAVGLNLGLNILFVLTWATYYRHAGLALATVLSSAVNAALLGRVLRRRVPEIDWRGLAAGSSRLAVAALVMGVCVVGLHRGIAGALAGTAWPEKLQQLLAVGASIICGLGIYLAASLLWAGKEVRGLMTRLRRRGRRAGSLASESGTG